jgi:hypothetical protein
LLALGNVGLGASYANRLPVCVSHRYASTKSLRG